MGEHCANNGADRATGAYWEREFAKMAAEHGKVFSFLQIGRKESAQFYAKPNGNWRHYTLPDVTIWTSPGEHHEIKHKNPVPGWGTFGLEVYRFNALIEFAETTGQDVMYTIHNHDLAGGPDVKQNDVSHWVTVDVTKLQDKWVTEKNGYSYVNGIKKEVPIYYWPQDLWIPLAAYWVLEPAW
jgi:hypothetical protein